jgi:hypothetical protein
LREEIDRVERSYFPINSILRFLLGDCMRRTDRSAIIQEIHGLLPTESYEARPMSPPLWRKNPPENIVLRFAGSFRRSQGLCMGLVVPCESTVGFRVAILKLIMHGMCWGKNTLRARFWVHESCRHLRGIQRADVMIALRCPLRKAAPRWVHGIPSANGPEGIEFLTLNLSRRQ